MNRLEKKLNAIYKPRPAPWKRPVLLIVSLAVLGACALAVLLAPTMPVALWLLLGLFGVLAIAGLVAATFGSDFWVALLLGSM